MKTNSIILTIYNQEAIIKDILTLNKSENTKELIIVFDGCNDKSEEYSKEILKNVNDINIIYEYADNIYEIKANNIGLRKSTCDYSMIIQDDMLIQEKDFDKRMLKPFDLEETFAVTSRLSHNYTFLNSRLTWTDYAGFDPYNPNITPSDRNTFSVRDVCNRGPLVFCNEKLQELNYLDEKFYPQSIDEHDICLRAWTKYGWISGSYWIKWTSEIKWGGTRKTPEKYIWLEKKGEANKEFLFKRHFLYFASNVKHNKNIKIK